MSLIDDIAAGTDIVMSAELIRLFKAAGCSPTECHACRKQIRAGKVFKLLPHTKLGERKSEDEMLCAKCGEPELVKRDTQAERDRNAAIRARGNYNGPRLGGGYSRPTKEQT